MRAILVKGHGAPDVLQLGEAPTPLPAKGEARVRVRATAVNRADVMQRRGKYPAPADVHPDILGLEFAGEVDQLGDGVVDVKVGDRVFGLAGGATYAEYVVVHSRTLAHIPDNLSFVEAASIPEAFITAYDAAVVQGGLCAGKNMLVSAVGSGVGTAAIQIAKAIGAFSVGTARSESKLDAARSLGMNHGVVAQQGKFADKVMAATNGVGVDVILELVGGSYVAEDIVCASPKACIMLVGLVAGARVEADLGTILRKRLTIKGTTLRMRPLEEKIQAGQILEHNLAPLFAAGILKPIIHKTFPLAEASAAHALMEADENFGKIVLEV